MSRHCIRIVGLADGRPTAYHGRWVVSMDVDAAQGRGVLVATSYPAKARQFDNAAAAWAYWQRRSNVRPTRPDGKPNRPLTAYTVVVEPVEPR